MSTWERIIAAIIAAGLLTMGAMTVYWQTWDSRLPIQDAGPARLTDIMGVQRNAFRPGEQFISHRYACLWRAVPGRMILTWEDGLIYSEPAMNVRSDVRLLDGNPFTRGCATRAYLYTVPQIPPGRYLRRTVVEYDLNWMVTRRVELPPTEIFVLP